MGCEHRIDTECPKHGLRSEGVVHDSAIRSIENQYGETAREAIQWPTLPFGDTKKKVIKGQLAMRNENLPDSDDCATGSVL